MQDLVGGQIDLMCAEASQTLTYLRSGKMKAFAVMAKTRWPALPDVPTTDEIGAPGMYISFWHGLWVQKGTPKQVIAKLNNAVVETLADPTVRQRLTDLGQMIATARPADTQRARRLSQGRDREVVAHHQGGKHQGGSVIERPTDRRRSVSGSQFDPRSLDPIQTRNRRSPCAARCAY